MLISPEHIQLNYWVSNRNSCGPADYNYTNKNMAYNLEPGQIIECIKYDGKRMNQTIEYVVEITVVGEKGVGFITSNNKKRYYPYEAEHGKLIIIPCYHFFSLEDLEDWLNGKEPHEDGRWYQHGGWRTKRPDLYSDENLKNFEKLGQIKLKLK